MTNKIFAFWESSNNSMPAYLELCKITWKMNIPDVEINIINYSNLHDYIGNTYDLEKLKKIPLAMQSDIISAAVLEKFGGIFLDIDCIVTSNIFDYFSELPKDKLIGFGYVGKGIHLAVLYAKQPGNVVLSQWRKVAQERLENLPENYGWDYFGNSIINPMIQDDQYKDKFLIIDRTESGNILESKLMIGSTWKNANEYYKNFYFNPNFSLKSNILDSVKFGIISLHNSWSPDHIKKEYNINKFLSYDLPIVTIFKKILSGEFGIKDNLFILKIWFQDKLRANKNKIVLRNIANILVIDFWINDVNYAFDIYQNSLDLELNFLVRNNDEALLKVKENLKSNFKANKTKIGTYKTKNEVLVKVLEVIGLIEISYKHVS